MGGQLQLVKLAETGDAVEDRRRRHGIRRRRSRSSTSNRRGSISQLAEQDIVKADTQAAVQTADDEVALLHARYDVRRAELDVQSNELVSAIKAQQNVLTLDEAKQRLAQLEADVKTHRETDRASGDGLREKRNKAQLSVQVAERNIDSLRVRAPFDGFVTVRTNFRAFGGIGFRGVMPDYRVGDAAFAGQSIADLIDSSHIEVTAKLPGAGSRERRARAVGRGRRGRAARRDAARHGAHGERRRIARHLRRRHAAVRHRVRPRRPSVGPSRRVGGDRDLGAGVRQRALHSAHRRVRRERQADGVRPLGRRLRRARSPRARLDRQRRRRREHRADPPKWRSSTRTRRRARVPRPQPPAPQRASR